MTNRQDQLKTLETPSGDNGRRRRRRRRREIYRMTPDSIGRLHAAQAPPRGRASAMQPGNRGGRRRHASRSVAAESSTARRRQATDDRSPTLGIFAVTDMPRQQSYGVQPLPRRWLLTGRRVASGSIIRRDAWLGLPVAAVSFRLPGAGIAALKVPDQLWIRVRLRGIRDLLRVVLRLVRHRCLLECLQRGYPPRRVQPQRQARSELA